MFIRSIKEYLSHSFGRNTPQGRAIMVVGMHRSGTSFLTGSLQQAGLELGSHSAWNPSNTRGNRENPGIMKFHDKVLRARGCSWDEPPEGPIEWRDSEYAAARSLISAYAQAPLWGFKDPRALLLVHGWQQLLPELAFVGIFRHPLAVARSLGARNRMPLPKALALWKTYNQRLLELHVREPFPLLCFDDDEASLHARLTLVLDALGLRPTQQERFYTNELRHHIAEDGVLPAEIESMHQELLARAPNM